MQYFLLKIWTKEKGKVSFDSRSQLKGETRWNECGKGHCSFREMHVLRL